jgi:hypothetical protein
MAALNGYQLKYEGQETEQQSSDTESEEVE